MTRKIILASSSKQRKALMDTINVAYDVIPADIDEKAIANPDFVKRAEQIARTKAEKIVKQYPDAIVIAGDTFTVCEQQMLEKPGDAEEAKEMLQLLSNNAGINYNGFCYIDRTNKIDFSTSVNVEFKFREISEKEIDEYVKKFPVTTWAAAYSPAYPYAMTFVEYLNGSLTGFTHGLPMELLIPFLEKSGIQAAP